jgi:hypothetical protein
LSQRQEGPMPRNPIDDLDAVAVQLIERDPATVS